MVRPEVDARKMFGRRHLRFDGRILQSFNGFLCHFQT